MSSADAHVVDWLKLIRAEDLEIPSLSLTKSQWTGCGDLTPSLLTHDSQRWSTSSF
jgi:hypothetical protein